MRPWMAWVLLAGVSSPGAAGAQAPEPKHYVFIDHGGEKVMVRGPVIRATDEQGSFIIDTLRKRVTIVDDTARKYATGTIDRLCEAVSDWKVMALYADMRDYIEYQRGAFVETNRPTVMLDAGDSMALDASDQGVTIEKKDRGDVIAGYSTTRYLVKENGVPAVDVWLSKDKELLPALDAIDLEAIRKLERCGIGPSAIDLEWIGYENRVEGSSRYTDLLSKGWVLKRRDRREGALFLHTRTVERRTLPRSEFAIPKGYQRLSFYGLVSEIVAGLTAEDEE